MPQEPLKRLTIRHNKLAKNIARTANVKRSANLAGFSPAYAQKLMHDQKFLTKLQLELDKQGLDDMGLVGKLKEGLEAYTVKKDKGEHYPDFHAIQKTLDMIFKLRGDYAPEKHEITQKQVIIHFTPEFLEGLKDSRILTDDEVKIIEKRALEEEK